MILVDSLMEFTCKRFSRHVATEVEPVGSGLYTRSQFWLHWAICPFCRRYWKEMKAIGEIHKAQSALSRHPSVSLSDVKQRLKDKLLKRGV